MVLLLSAMRLKGVKKKILLMGVEAENQRIVRVVHLIVVFTWGFCVEEMLLHEVVRLLNFRYIYQALHLELHVLGLK